MISFTVLGTAQTAGSKRAFALRRKDGSIVTRPGGSPVIAVTDDNPRSKDWKQQIASAVRERYDGPLLDGPLAVVMTFYRPRPKAHYRRSGELSTLGLETPFPDGRPDVLKLARAVEDALSGVAWRDDAQIVEETLRKRWGEPARVDIAIRQFGS